MLKEVSTKSPILSVVGLLPAKILIHVQAGFDRLDRRVIISFAESHIDTHWVPKCQMFVPSSDALTWLLGQLAAAKKSWSQN